MKNQSRMSKIFLTRHQAMQMLSMTSVITFARLADAFGLKPKFKSGSRKYYARADIEKIRDECMRPSDGTED